MPEEPKEEVKLTVDRPELTRGELQILINVIAQASVKLVDASILIQLSNKLSQMVDKVNP